MAVKCDRWIDGDVYIDELEGLIFIYCTAGKNVLRRLNASF